MKHLGPNKTPIRPTMASRDRSRTPLRLTSLPAPIQNRILKDATLMILQGDFVKASTLAMAAADRMDLVQGMRSPRASAVPVTLEERHAWQAHLFMGQADPMRAMEDRLQAKASQTRFVEASTAATEGLQRCLEE